MKVLGTLGLGLRKEQHHLSISSVTFPARQIQQKVFLKRSNMAISRSAMTGSGLRTFVANSALEAIFGPQGLIRAAGSESGSSLRGIATASAQPNIFGQLHHGACKCSSCTRSGGSHQLGCTRSGCNSVSISPSKRGMRNANKHMRMVPVVAKCSKCDKIMRLAEVPHNCKAEDCPSWSFAKTSTVGLA